MTTVAPSPASSERIPELQNGDRLTRVEFARRYSAMPGLKKAELIEGVVFLPSPVRMRQHSNPDALLVTWLGNYRARHLGVAHGTNATVRLDADNEVQPDILLRISHGGTSIEREDGFIYGPPELVVEIAASSVSVDMHAKKNVYRRSGVAEYIVWRTEDGAVDWFRLEDGAYVPIVPGADGVIESHRFPGLRLDVPALLAGDLALVLAALDR